MQKQIPVRHKEIEALIPKFSAMKPCCSGSPSATCQYWRGITTQWILGYFSWAMIQAGPGAVKWSLSINLSQTVTKTLQKAAAPTSFSHSFRCKISVPGVCSTCIGTEEQNISARSPGIVSAFNFYKTKLVGTVRITEYDKKGTLLPLTRFLWD